MDFDCNSIVNPRDMYTILRDFPEDRKAFDRFSIKAAFEGEEESSVVCPNSSCGKIFFTEPAVIHRGDPVPDRDYAECSADEWTAIYRSMFSHGHDAVTTGAHTS